MAELMGILVIALSSLTLFALASVQVAHRLTGPRDDVITRTVVLPELDDLPLPLVTGLAAAIAASSQLPVAYLVALPVGRLSAGSLAILVAEALVVVGWCAYLSVPRRTARAIMESASVTTFARFVSRSRKAA